MKIGNVVKWIGKASKHKIGIVLSYCDFQQLWFVVFADGEYEIEESALKVIIDVDDVQQKTAEPSAYKEVFHFYDNQ